MHATTQESLKLSQQTYVPFLCMYHDQVADYEISTDARGHDQALEEVLHASVRPAADLQHVPKRHGYLTRVDRLAPLLQGASTLGRVKGLGDVLVGHEHILGTLLLGTTEKRRGEVVRHGGCRSKDEHTGNPQRRRLAVRCFGYDIL